MLLATHSLVGAFIGKEIGYPPLAFLLGIISHLLLDCVPHYDGPDDGVDKADDGNISAGQYVVIFIDFAIAVSAFIYLGGHNSIEPVMLWGAAGGIFPDFVDNIPFWSPRLQKLWGLKQFHAFHARIQSVKLPMFIGFLSQYMIAGIFLWFLVAL